MTAEEAIREYPDWLKQKKILELQITNFENISESDIIDSMTFSQPNDERVQSNTISNKTAKIALVYRERLRIGLEEDEKRLKSLISQHIRLCSKIKYLESCISTLSGELSEIMSDLIINGLCWEEVGNKYNLSRSALARRRKKALKELNVIYK